MNARVAATHTITAKIVNRLGMHARPAMSFVDLAQESGCAVSVKRVGSDEILDGTSIMQVMMLAATCGSELEITCEGDNAEQACEQLRALVEGGFDEP